jgi:hypothetical protein
LLAKTYLAIVGLLYLGLALWCSVSPEVTSQKVGFQLLEGSGDSEFLVIYGGLELAMAIVFLLPLAKNDWLPYSLTTCLIIHACLVVFRTIGYLAYAPVSEMTMKLAIGEWAILILGMVVFSFRRRAARAVAAISAET